MRFNAASDSSVSANAVKGGRNSPCNEKLSESEIAAFRPMKALASDSVGRRLQYLNCLISCASCDFIMLATSCTLLLVPDDDFNLVPAAQASDDRSDYQSPFGYMQGVQSAYLAFRALNQCWTPKRY